MGLDKKWKNQLLLIKTETTSGTDAVPTAAANAIQAFNVSLSVEADEQSRQQNRSYFTAPEKSYTNKRFTLSFDIELAASGTAGTAPAIGPIFTMCQYSETVVASTSVTYAPASSSTDTSTIYLNIDGILFKAVGAKGSMNIDFTIGSYAKATVTATGLYLTPTDVPITAGTYTAFRAPINCSQEESTLTIHGTTVDGRALTLSQGNDNQLRESTETKVIETLDRQVSAEARFWMPSVATLDVYDIFDQHTKNAVVWTNGTTAGDIITLNLPQAQLGAPAPTNDEDVAGFTVPITPYSTASGDDEHTIVFT